MDNPQHYQPLSHALHPPATTRSIYSAPTTSSAFVQPQSTAADPPKPQEEEEEEEEEEDGDEEGLVEEQLNNDADALGSNHSSPKTSGNTDAQASYNQPSLDDQSPQEPERKRRPGRPRGSKNRRPRVGSSKHEGQFYYGASPTGAVTTSSGPPHHPSMNAQNQQYYEFQWRVLNLCAEFYGAAEELVKGTAPLVVAQCYHMGPGVTVDPLSMLGEAKRICDTLLAKPSQLVSNPPPPMYPVVPGLYQPIANIQPQPVASASTTSGPVSTNAVASPSSVITNAQSFVVPLGAQAAYPHYPSALGQYATTPYYHQYAYAAGLPGNTFYPPQQAQSAPPAIQPQSAQPRAPTAATTATTQPTATITTTPATGGTVVGNQGAWSDEETERLKKMAEEHRVKATGEINWDTMIQEWGISRTRHQILIKATALGLKESSSRGVKRRREDAPGDAPTISSGPSTSTASNVMGMPSTSSPSHSGSTPAASPALQNIQRPPSAKSTAPIAATPATLAAPAAQQLAWPMPVVAVNAPTTSVIATPPTHEQQQQRTSYYRPRPNQTDATGKSNNNSPPSQPTMHHYMFTPNGQVSSGLRPKENGK